MSSGGQWWRSVHPKVWAKLISLLPHFFYMFGEHGLRTRFIKIGDKRIHLLEEKGGDIVRYRRMIRSF